MATCRCGEEMFDGHCPLCSHLLRAGMPHRYLEADRSHFQEEMDEYFDKKENLYITGSIGTGKTWLMAAIMRDQIQKTKNTVDNGRFSGYVGYVDDSSLFVSLPELTFKIRASMDRDSEDTEYRILSKYGRVRSLFFDDIGAERTTEYSRSALFLLMERRNTMANGRTIITSNLSLNQLASEHGERIASRIAEMCNVIRLTGKDRRIQH